MKYIFFDMDNTLTESKQKISPKMKKCLQNLKEPFAVISGASQKQMEYQLDGLKCSVLSQSGNNTPLWCNKLTKQEVEEVYAHIRKIISNINKNQVENRGCQIALSFVGHNAHTLLKKSFDPDKILRKLMLKKVPFKSKTLTVRIAGTTCLDYTHKNGTKGDNIKRWIKENGLIKKDCVYYGDALFQGGNDESVIGVIKTIGVKDPQDTFNFIKRKKYNILDLAKISKIVKGWSIENKPAYRGYYCGNCLKIIRKAWHIWFEQDYFKCEVHLCKKCFKLLKK